MLVEILSPTRDLSKSQESGRRDTKSRLFFFFQTAQGQQEKKDVGRRGVETCISMLASAFFYPKRQLCC